MFGQRNAMDLHCLLYILISMHSLLIMDCFHKQAHVSESKTKVSSVSMTAGRNVSRMTIIFQGGKSVSHGNCFWESDTWREAIH